MIMRFGLFLCFFCTSLLWAQFSEFAPTADGSSVYFSTEYVQKKTTQPSWGKIFVINGQGVQPYAIKFDQTDLDNFYDLSGPSVSSDGKVVAYVGTRKCPFSFARQCDGYQFTQTTITDLSRNKGRTFDGRGYVSRNGRFVCMYKADFSGHDIGIWDLQIDTLIPRSTCAPNFQSLADDGSVVSDSGAVMRNGQVDGLLGEQTESAVLDRLGTFIVFTSRWREPNGAFSRLRFYDLNSHTVRTLAEGAGDVSQPTLSDDGRQVLFLSTARFSRSSPFGPAQAFLVGLDGSAPHQLTTEPAGIRSAVLSGDGRTVFVFTYGGRFLRLNVDVPDKAVELIPRTPLCCSVGNTVAGSLFTLGGIGLTDSDGNPPAILLNGQPIPLVSSSSRQLSFVLPWESADQTVTIDLSLTSDSTFELPSSATKFVIHPVSLQPEFFKIPPEYGLRDSGFGKAAHQNFEGIVSRDSPARAGETIHLYARGLGPVDDTGRVRQPFDCSIRSSTPVNAPVLFAGLAPGIPGVYQVDLLIPVSVALTDSVIVIACGSTETTLPIGRD